MARNRFMSNISFRCMSMIHDHPLRYIFDPPEKTLKAAGLQPGQQVLEVGCGPGFFTIAAAKLVGEKGLVHAIDLHPLAIQAVEKKMRRAGVTNIRVRIADVAEIGLPDASIDLTFLFGVVHSLPLPTVLPELHRLLKPGGDSGSRVLFPSRNLPLPKSWT